MQEYTILINSCDAYSDVWMPFFRILENTWPECKEHRIVLNTESKKYTDSFFNVEVINSPEELWGVNKWGGRLKHVLSKIDTEYVFFLLEDFFFEKRINEEEINRCIKYMGQDKNIASFTMVPAGKCAKAEYCVRFSKYNDYLEREQKEMYKLAANPGLWRKEALEKWTMDNDTAWEWEYFGTMRTWFSKAKFYSRKITSTPIFVYDVEHGGAIHRGKWVGKSVRRILKENGIVIDLDERGVVEDWMENIQQPKPFFLRIKSIIHNRLLKYINVLLAILKYR